jgi:hypothetical protein
MRVTLLKFQPKTLKPARGCLHRLMVLIPDLRPNGPFVRPARANGPGRSRRELPQGLKGRQFLRHSSNYRAVGPQTLIIAIATQAVGLGWAKAWPLGPKVRDHHRTNAPCEIGRARRRGGEAPAEPHAQDRGVPSGANPPEPPPLPSPPRPKCQTVPVSGSSRAVWKNAGRGESLRGFSGFSGAPLVSLGGLYRFRRNTPQSTSNSLSDEVVVSSRSDCT